MKAMRRYCLASGRRRKGYRAMSSAMALAAAGILGSGWAQAAAPEPSRRGAAGATTACPSLEFGRFLKAFAESADVQRAFTRFPLVRRHIDKSATPEPAPAEEQLQAEKVSFPLFPNDEARARQGFSMRVRERSPRRVEVVLWEEDTGHQIAFTFERNGCWRLVLIDDQSV